MFGFGKKEKVEFEATERITNYLEYDANSELVRFDGKHIFRKSDIQLCRVKYGSKTYDKVNLGRAALGAAAFGIVGYLLAGTHEEDYVSNITFEIKANDKFYYKPLTIGKVKAKNAKTILEVAEKAMDFLNN